MPGAHHHVGAVLPVGVLGHCLKDERVSHSGAGLAHSDASGHRVQLARPVPVAGHQEDQGQHGAQGSVVQIDADPPAAHLVAARIRAGSSNQDHRQNHHLAPLRPGHRVGPETGHRSVESLVEA